MENFLFTGAFWGFLLVLAGILVVLNGLFHTQIPTFRIVVAVVFVAVGIMILNGGFKMRGHTDQNSVIFGSSTMSPPSEVNNEYSIVLGSGIVQLKNISLEKGIVNIKVNTVMGSGVVELPSNMPVKISANAVFGDVRFPDGSFTSFGRNLYESDGLKTGSNYLYIDANAVFGSLRIIRQ